MLRGLDAYGSDEESDEDVSPSPQILGKPGSSQTTALCESSTQDHVRSKGIQLPARTNKSGRRKDGPVRIKIDPLKQEDDEEKNAFEPLVKRPRTADLPAKGAGSSSLVSILSKLPAPKAAPALPKPARVLGGGLQSGGHDHGIDTTSEYPSPGAPPPPHPSTEAITPATAYVPSSLTKSRNHPGAPKSAPSSVQPSVHARPSAPVIDFFSLGPCYHYRFITT
jgi:hypothetical protein